MGLRTAAACLAPALLPARHILLLLAQQRAHLSLPEFVGGFAPFQMQQQHPTESMFVTPVFPGFQAEQDAAAVDQACKRLEKHLRKLVKMVSIVLVRMCMMCLVIAHSSLQDTCSAQRLCPGGLFAASVGNRNDSMHSNTCCT
jgi:hypothetical protein